MNRAGEAVGDSLLRDMRELALFLIGPVFLCWLGKDTMERCTDCSEKVSKTIPAARAVIWSYYHGMKFVLYAKEHTMN